jgi:cytochrome d ubiquinol oxidase subunit I
MLWILMLAAPFPFIANTTGWMTAELGRQPWLVYGVLRTQDGYSATVSSGNTIFSLLGFMGMYLVLGVLFVLLAVREIGHGPGGEPVPAGGGGHSSSASGPGGPSTGGGAGGVPHVAVPSAHNEGR